MNLVKKTNSNFLETHLFNLLLFIVFWAPIPLASNRPWAWGILEIFCYLLFIGAVWVHKDSWKSKLYDHLIPVLCISSFLIWNLIQILPLPIEFVSLVSPQNAAFYSASKIEVDYVPLSIDAGQSLVSLYKGLAYWCVFMSVLILCNNDNRIRTLTLCIVTTGIFQATYGTLEILSGVESSLFFELPVTESATGSFIYKNHFANYLMLCLSMGVGYLVGTLTNGHSTNRQRIRSLLTSLLSTKALVRIGLAIMVIALVMSRSRMGNTAFFASMTVVGLLALWLIKKKSRGLMILITSMFIIDTLILSTWFGLDKVKDRIETTSFTQETRDEVVIDSLPIVKDYLITGSGMGSFYTIYPVYQGDSVNMFYDHAHNDYLQFVIEAGAIACIIVLVLPIVVIKRCIKAFRKRKNRLIQGVAFGTLMAVIGMAIHISVDFPLQAPANVVLFVVILALGLLTKKSTTKTFVIRK